jgi:hypothetical protein
MAVKGKQCGLAVFGRLRHIGVMTAMIVEPTDVVPSATLRDEADAAAWNALPRDEQVLRYRALFASPACGKISDDSMSDILAAARQRVAERRRA